MKNYNLHKQSHPHHYSTIADKWESFEHTYYKTHPKKCAACNERLHIDLHHIIPRHINPSLIFTESNLTPLCRCDHFRIGHHKNWDTYNPNVTTDSKTFNKLLQKETLK